MALVSQKLDSIKKKALEYQIPMLRAQSTATRFGNMLRNNTIPRGCLPICKLQLPNPPVSMVTAWNSCLKDCGQQLTLMIIDYNLNKFSELQEAIDKLVENAFNNIRAEFTSLPELESKLQATITEIKAANDKNPTELIERLNKKRTNNTDTDTPSTKKQKNSPSPSESEGIKTLIRQVIGEMSSPSQFNPPYWTPRGRGRGSRGRGRGRGERQ